MSLKASTYNLNEGQAALFNEVVDPLRDVPQFPDPDASPVLLVTGLAGCGKTHVILAIFCAFQSHGKRFLKTSFNTLVAHAIGGNTFCSTMGWSPGKGHFNASPPFKAHKLQNFYAQHDIDPDAEAGFPDSADRIASMIVDEVSTKSLEMLLFLDRRLRQAFQRPDEPYGGLKILLLGNFDPKGPVQAPSLPYAVIDCASFDMERQAFQQQMAKRARRSPAIPPQQQASHSHGIQPVMDPEMVRFSPDHPYRNGINIITKASRQQLTQQVRATDPAQVAFVQKLFEGQKLSAKDFAHYKCLSEEDLRNDDWVDAPILTTTNREWFTLTHNLAVARARRRKTVVIRWRAHAS
jgi:hypothetical protein